MTTTLQVVQAFDAYRNGDQLPLPDAAAQVLQNAYPGRFQFVSRTPDVPGSQVVVPAQPNRVFVVGGVPDPVLAALYGYALDLTSTPATLYKWSGTAWAIVLQAGTGGSAPILNTLALSALAGTSGSVFSANIQGATAGSALAATAADGTILTIANGVLSGTFATAGQKQISIVETLAGAMGSPKTTTLTLTISAAAPVLQALGLASQSAVAGAPFSAAIAGQTAGSTIAATSSDGTVLTVANGQVSGTFTAAGAPTVTLTETLAGATGSPKATQLALTVTTVAVDRTATTDLSNPDRGLNPLI